MPAGELRELVAFEKRGPVEGSYGKKPGAWAEQFRTPARIRYLQGTEPVMAQRLRGINPVVVTVPSFGASELVTSGWRIRDLRDGTTFNIRSVKPSERVINAIDFLCETGGTADG